MASYSPGLAALGELAGQHHERLDGSGYPQRLRGDAISPLSHVLAVADAYVTKLEPRPHRRPLTGEGAASYLRREAVSGRMDGAVVNAVLAASGHRVRRRPQHPAGLTPREIEVLRLLARGGTRKEIAVELYISPKTASSHLEHIYAKIGASNRATASLFAVSNGLMDF